MTERRSELVTAVAAIAATVLFAAEILTWKNPHPDDPLSKITNYFVINRGLASASILFGLMGWLAILIFAAGLRSILWRREGQADILSSLTLAGGVLALSAEIIFTSTTGAVTILASHASESQLRVLLALVSITDLLRVGALGVFVGAASLGMINGRVFARWIGWLGVVISLLYLVSQGAILDILNHEGIGNASIVGLVLLPIWTIAISVSLIRRRVVSASVQQAH